MSKLQQLYRPTPIRSSMFQGVGSLPRFINDYPLNINPNFQRGVVWTPQQQSQFVGHLLGGGAVLPCLINEGPTGAWEVAELIDGQQRVTACLAFLKGDIPAEFDSKIYLESGELDEVDCRVLKNTIGLEFGIVRLSKIDSIELYLRINRGGVIHTEEELAHAETILRELQCT